MDQKLGELETGSSSDRIGNAIRSYCGVLSHWENFNVRQTMLLKRHDFTRFGIFDYDLTHFFD